MTTMKIEILKSRNGTESKKYTWTYKEFDFQVARWKNIGIHLPSGRNVYQVSVGDIAEWIESQPTDMWMHGDEDNNGTKLRYLLSPEIEAWFLLKFS